MNVCQKSLMKRIITSGLILVFFLIFSIFHKVNDFLKIYIFFISYLIVGYDIIFKTVKNIWNLKIFDEKTLMFIATVGAFFLKQYFEAVLIFLLYQVGELFQNIAVVKSKDQISSALKIRPEYANLKQYDSVKKVDPKQVCVEDVIVIKPGERVPLDGVVMNGGSFLDMSSISGESNLLSVGIGDEIISGSVNVSGVLEIRVKKKYENSTVKKILDLIENVSDKKSKTENLIKRFAKIYTPCVVLAAFLILIIPIIFLGGSFYVWLERALIFLVISCPCALVISVPISFFLAVSKSAKYGVLIKGSIFLELLSIVKTIVFDKTGTLTKGKFTVKKIICQNINEFDEQNVLEIVALAESKLNHPIAKSICKAYGKQINLDRIKNIREIYGKGVSGFVDDREVLVGNLKLMNECGINGIKEYDLGTSLHLAVDKKFVGSIILTDDLKDNLKEVLGKLRDVGVLNLVMLTGDKKNIGEYVSKKISLDSVFCELLPFEKVEKLQTILNNKKVNESVVFVGDGVNDAAALKIADVGVAMGQVGSDAAMEACDVALMDDDLKKLVVAILISKEAKKTVKQNIFFSLFFKGLIFLFGALGFTNIWVAIFSDVGVSILTILNAFRVFKKKVYLK